MFLLRVARDFDVVTHERAIVRPREFALARVNQRHRVVEGRDRGNDRVLVSGQRQRRSIASLRSFVVREDDRGACGLRRRHGFGDLLVRPLRRDPCEPQLHRRRRIGRGRDDDLMRAAGVELDRS